MNEAQQKALLAVTADLTSEALSAAAQTLGFVAPPPAPQDSPDLQAHDQFTQAASGSEPPPLDRDAEIDRQLAAAPDEKTFMEIYRASGRAIQGSN